VYNEEKILPRKLKNLQDIQYTAGRLEILIGSDGSTDQTVALLKQANVKNCHVYPFDRRRGKAGVLNDLVKMAKGEFVVFSDANTMFRPATLKLLVEPFMRRDVGAVSGELLLEGESNSGESLYWKYETFIKRHEDTVGTLLGATGGVYAIRKSLFKPIPDDRSLADDFIIPMSIVEQGYRVVYVPGAVATEAGELTISGEFQRKVRIGAQNFNSIPLLSSLLKPAAGFVAFALWSHKIIRWIVPFLLLALAGSTLILAPRGGVYLGSLIGGAAILLAAGLGAVAEHFKFRNPFIALPYYFLAMNAALFIGLIRSIRGVERPTWNVQR
jgi:cellulose synthase/poly-beta-1,6-N-acetylglucosamine synthase-like glycosyltransferase